MLTLLVTARYIVVSLDECYIYITLHTY